MANFAPKLTPQKDSSKDILKQLKDIDSNVLDFFSQSKGFKKNYNFDTKKEMSDLKKSITSFTETINHGINTTGLEGKNLEKYIKTQTDLRKKENQYLKDAIDETRESILKKKKLSKLDIKSLSDLDTLGSQFKEPLEDPLSELKESIQKFTTTLDDGIDVAGLSAKDRKAYLKKQNELSKQETENLKESIKSTRESILSKDVLTEADKKSLEELNSIQKSLVKYGVKQDSIFDELKENIAGPLKQGFGSMAKDISTGLLGPLNLITQPLEELFGVKFIDVIGGIFGKGKDDFFAKGKKVKPKLSDIQKSNPEIVWLAKQLGADTEEKKKKKKGGLLDELFGGDGGVGDAGGLAKNVLPLLAKGAPVAAIAAGVVMATLDGIAAVGKANNWGVDKAAAFRGGFLGGTGEGFKNAFKKAGQFALVGAGIGFLAGGPVGALIGGFIGAATGGILGYIGGEKIAKAIQGVRNWVKDAINSVFEGIKSYFKETFDNIVGLFKGTFKNIGDVFSGKKAFTQGLIDIPMEIFQFIGKQIQISWKTHPFLNYIQKTILNPVFDLLKSTGHKIAKFPLTPVGKFIQKNIMNPAFDLLKSFGSKIAKFPSTPIGNFIQKNVMNPIFDLFKSIGDELSHLASSPVGKFIQKNVMNPIFDLFKSIGDAFTYFTSTPITKLISDISTGHLVESLDDFHNKQQIGRDKKELTESVDYKTWNSQLSKSQKESYSTEDEGIKAFLSDPKRKEQFLEEWNATHNHEFDTTSVNDAIIRPSGKIIRPSPDDTIIATKSPVMGFDSANMGMNLDQLSKAVEDSGKGNEIVQALEKLIDIVKDKPFNNIIQNNTESPVDFNQLRMAF
jgi:hypothetical protein